MNCKYLENSFKKKKTVKKRDLKIVKNSYGVETTNIDQYINKFKQILEQIKYNENLDNIDLWVKELIVQTEIIIQDYNNNLGYANIRQKEVNSIDVYKCYRYFTIYMRTYVNFFTAYFIKISP